MRTQGECSAGAQLAATVPFSLTLALILLLSLAGCGEQTAEEHENDEANVREDDEIGENSHTGIVKLRPRLAE